MAVTASAVYREEPVQVTPTCYSLTRTSPKESRLKISGRDSSSQFQKALLLHQAKQPYTLVTDHPIPSLLGEDEVLIKVAAIGLNPVDWKSPAFNFGIPGLPWVFGRDLAGVVVQTSPSHSSMARIQKGDLVLVPSTDYRDIRKAAFQEYAVAAHFNAARIPRNTSVFQGASLGVAFVAATLALGVCFGLDFSTLKAAPGPNLQQILHGIDRKGIPEDIAAECFSVADTAQRVRPGDWIAIWGASTTTGYIILQIAKQCGLKVICVADIARHGRQLRNAGADLLVDRYDTIRAVKIIHGVIGGRLRYALDMVGRETATILQDALDTNPEGPQAHLLGLTSLPKDKHPQVCYHNVPIKLFHLYPSIGDSIMHWLECLLAAKALQPPDLVLLDEGGLAVINDALKLLEKGTVSGKRVVIDLDNSIVKNSYMDTAVN
ncbi:Oxidoreductase zinc-binding dehydrogenase family [Penicillium longicatenatum]|nr:Oxidoreductase zinc-binding dehydrogenase family [Penicillium longicatenatum]